MNSIRFKLGTHVLLVVSCILISTVAVAAGASLISPSAGKKPAYVILAQDNIEHNKTIKKEQLREFTRVSD